MDQNVWLAFVLTAIAGLSTGIGSAIAFFLQRSNKGFLAASLGFSAGVMIYISFVEIFPAAQELLAARYGEKGGMWITILGFFGGMAIIGVIDYFVPSYANPHDAVLAEEVETRSHDATLKRLGILTALAIGIHNFPEGIVTFFSTLSSATVGISIAVAVALHNIPEGIAVSVPIYYSTGSRTRAFWLSMLSGVSEPIGAIVAYVLLRAFLADHLVGIVFAAVAGIMVFVSLDQLIPNAKKYGESHQSVYGLVVGMAIMAVTLILL
jgi:ZIP family zinc transporter